MEIQDQQFKEFLLPYELSVQGFVIKLEGIKRQYRQKGLHSPIETVTGRVKSIPSIFEKLERMNLSFNQIDQLYDIAGMRIICKYVEDIYDVVEMLKSRRDIEVVKEKNYIAEAKESGYRSYHIVGKYYVETIDGAKPIMVEFQIRTNAMHLWATVEHRLNYKYDDHIPERIKSRLQRAAQAAAALDEEISAIKEEIEEAQRVFKDKKPKTTSQVYSAFHSNTH